jgi:polysaccharide biosynthesis protein PslA
MASAHIERRVSAIPARSAASRPIPTEAAIAGLRIVEAAMVPLGGLLAYWVHPQLSDLGPTYKSTLALVTLVASILLTRLGAYELNYVFARRAQLRRQMAALGGTVLTVLVLAFMLKISDHFSRLWVGTWLVYAAGLLTMTRIGFSWLAAGWVRDARLALRTVIVGTGEHGLRLAEHLTACDDVRTQIVGFADDRALGPDGARLPGGAQARSSDAACTPIELAGYPVLGDVSDVVGRIRRGEVDQVVIALPWTARERIMAIITQLTLTPVHIRLAPELLRFEFLNRGALHVGGVPLLKVFDRPISGEAAVVKAIEDRVLGAALLVLCAPLLALVALAIRVDSPGPVFFRQTRLGFNQNRIRVWKFRTMYHHMCDDLATRLTERDDPRVTRVGRFLRRTSLDELPQLFNVVLGEMSLVGPRPHALAAKAGDQLYEDVVSNYAARHRVKPGLTGWAQVNGWRGETDTPYKLTRRVEHDLYYIDHWSPWLDIKILARTVLVVLSARNAF